MRWHFGKYMDSIFFFFCQTSASATRRWHKLSCTLHETSIFAIAPENRISCYEQKINTLKLKNCYWKNNREIWGKTHSGKSPVHIQAIAFLCDIRRAQAQARREKLWFGFMIRFVITWFVTNRLLNGMMSERSRAKWSETNSKKHSMT